MRAIKSVADDVGAYGVATAWSEDKKTAVLDTKTFPAHETPREAEAQGVLQKNLFFPVVMAKDQPEYEQLPALKSLFGEVVTRWTFTQQEREAIAAGADVFIAQLTFGEDLQPIMTKVGTEISDILVDVVEARR